jgi:hypothetical protein
MRIVLTLAISMVVFGATINDCWAPEPARLTADPAPPKVQPKTFQHYTRTKSVLSDRVIPPCGTASNPCHPARSNVPRVGGNAAMDRLGGGAQPSLRSGQSAGGNAAAKSRSPSLATSGPPDSAAARALTTNRATIGGTSAPERLR